MVVEDLSMSEQPRDPVVIYWSDEDQEHVAHSLNHDQIGTGETVLLAFADCIRAVEQVKRLASEKEGIVVFSKAPEDVWKRLENAVRLPEEVNKMAYWRANDHWPELVEFPDFVEDSEQTFVADLEGAAA